MVTVFSEIGVLLLMFLAGLETNLNDLNENKKSATFVAIGGVVAPIVNVLFCWTILQFLNGGIHFLRFITFRNVGEHLREGIKRIRLVKEPRGICFIGSRDTG